jgi:hypothetical protein
MLGRRFAGWFQGRQMVLGWLLVCVLPSEGQVTNKEAINALMRIKVGCDQEGLLFQALGLAISALHRQTEPEALTTARAAWRAYKKYLVKKYPAKPGETWNFTCEHHKALEKALAEPERWRDAEWPRDASNPPKEARFTDSIVNDWSCGVLVGFHNDYWYDAEFMGWGYCQVRDE